MLTEKELKDLLDIPEADRTPDQKSALAEFFTAAGRKAEEPKDDGKKRITMEEAFELPRFKELIEKKNNAEAKAAALEKAAQEAERKQLEETQNYKALYEKAQAEIMDLKPKAGKLEQTEKSLGKLLETQILELPEQFRSVVPEHYDVQQKLDWLAEHKARFQKPEAFDIGAGAKGGKKPDDKNQELSAEEKVAAQQLGMSESDYVKFKDNVAPVQS